MDVVVAQDRKDLEQEVSDAFRERWPEFIFHDEVSRRLRHPAGGERNGYLETGGGPSGWPPGPPANVSQGMAGCCPTPGLL